MTLWKVLKAAFAGVGGGVGGCGGVGRGGGGSGFREDIVAPEFQCVPIVSPKP